MRSRRPKSFSTPPDREGLAPRPARVLSPQEQREALMEYALRALAQRSLSEAELRAKLRRRPATDEDSHAELCEDVIGRLKELRYLDDSQVARAENQRKGVGAYRARARMQRRGLEPELIEEALQQRSSEAELEEACALLQRRLSSFMRGSNPKARAYGYLARRGYASSVVSQALASIDWQTLTPEGGWPDA